MILHTNPLRSQEKNFLQALSASLPPTYRLYTKPPQTPSTDPLKKSRRTSRKQSRKPKKWKANKAKIDWKYLAQQPGWELLSKDEQEMLKLGWPERNFLLSYKEIGATLDISVDSAKRRIKKWKDNKKIKKRKSFLKRHGKETGIHKRNHYTLSKQTKKEMEEVVKKLFPEAQKIAPRKDLTKVRKDCQDKNELSNEKEKFEGTEKEYHEFLEKRFEELVAEKESLNSAVATLFDAHGFKSHLSTLCPHFLKKLNEAHLKQLVKALKLVEKKVKKGFRIRNFWAFFRYVLENKTNCWLTKRADDYKQAIEKKTKLEGVDSQTVVEQIIKLQERTGQEAKGEELRGLLCFGASHLSALLKVVNFKLNITPVKNWIGYVFFLAKKPIMELAKMYKSQKQLQAEKEFATGKKVDEKTAWDNYRTFAI